MHDYKYIHLLSPYLSRFKAKSDRLYNFRCPLCGDSEKSGSKARGYIFEHEGSYAFKCHNCGAATSLGNLIRAVAPSLFQDFIFEKYRENKPEPKPEPDFRTEMRFGNDRTMAERIKSIDPKLFRAIADSPTALDFMRGRKIPESMFGRFLYCPDINMVAGKLDRYKDWKMPSVQCIVIPYWSKSGDLTHIQTRMIDDGNLRYLTLKVTEDETVAPVWGLDCVDFTKQISITEGVFDATFVNNCAAANTAGNLIATAEQVIKHGGAPRLIFDADMSTNFEVWNFASTAIDKGFPIVIFDSEFAVKDINFRVQRGWSLERLNMYLKIRTFKGLNARLEFAKIRKPKKDS